jgi:acyl-CoA thioesterase
MDRDPSHASTPSLAQLLDALAPGVPCGIPDGWLQGRTAYGGLSAAMAVHLALQANAESLPPLKAAQVSFVGPVTAAACFTTELMRRGKSVTQVGVDARVDDALVLRAGFVFAAPRVSTIAHQRVARPDVPGPEACSPSPVAASLPAHFRNFDVRFCGDALPISGATEPELLAWVRLNDASGVSPAAALLALGDCLPPAAMACFTAPAPISSMTWAVDFAQPAQHSAWYLQRTRSLAAQDGYSFQIMEMWDADGALVLVSTQTVAIFA